MRHLIIDVEFLGPLFDHGRYFPSLFAKGSICFLRKHYVLVFYKYFTRHFYISYLHGAHITQMNQSFFGRSPHK